jgi:ABC-2 type transport system permease protein
LFKGVGSLILKEVKELVRDPKILIGMIIIPLVMFPLMGLAIRTSMESAQQSLKKISLVTINLDNDTESFRLIDYLKENGVQIYETPFSDWNQTLQFMREKNATELLMIPEGFTAHIVSGNAGTVISYSMYTGKSLLEGAGATIINSLLESYKSEKTFVTISQSIVNNEPVNVDPRTLSSVLMSQYVAMPVTIMVLLVFAMQIAATSVASEKEEKTLETLLTLPINRFTILAGKLVGSVVVAAVGAVTYMVGFNYYMGSFSASIPDSGGIDLAKLGLAPTPLAYFLLGASLFVSMLSALALAVVLSAFAEDVRGAQALVGYIYPLLFVPMIFLMFADVNALPLALRIVLLAIPYSHPMLTARAALTGDYLTPVFGIIYVSAFTTVVLYVAAKLFATEKILTMKLRFRGLKLRKKQVEEL